MIVMGGPPTDNVVPGPMTTVLGFREDAVTMEDPAVRTIPEDVGEAGNTEYGIVLEPTMMPFGAADITCPLMVTGAPPTDNVVPGPSTTVPGAIEDAVKIWEPAVTIAPLAVDVGKAEKAARVDPT